jgi:hypothetical protein
MVEKVTPSIPSIISLIIGTKFSSPRYELIYLLTSTILAIESRFFSSLIVFSIIKNSKLINLMKYPRSEIKYSLLLKAHQLSLKEI